MWEKIIFIPSQRYDAPPRKVGKIFVGILSVELDRVCARKEISERVVIFQSVILQCAQGINNSAQIRKRILFQLDCWNYGEFGVLVKDTYNSDIGYL